MILNLLACIADYTLVLACGCLSAIVPKKVKPKIEKFVSNTLIIQCPDAPKNKCYGVQVFDFQNKKK